MNYIQLCDEIKTKDIVIKNLQNQLKRKDQELAQNQKSYHELFLKHNENFDLQIKYESQIEKLRDIIQDGLKTQNKLQEQIDALNQFIQGLQTQCDDKDKQIKFLEKTVYKMQEEINGLTDNNLALVQDNTQLVNDNKNLFSDNAKLKKFINVQYN